MVTLALAHRAALALPPAFAHRAALGLLAMGWPVRRRHLPAPPVTVAGVTFPNPVGLAAGFDKNAVALPGLARLGFGHAEVGTVTPRPQAGNPGVALFRLRADRALINRLGMPSDGAEAVAARIAAWRETNPDAPLRLGISVGPNRDSPDVPADVAQGIRRLGPLADYIVINLSSPNTAGLRDWQSGVRLVQALEAGAGARAQLQRRPPLFVKIAPNLAEEAEAALVEQVLAAGLDGLVVCNTTTARPADLRARDAGEAGGLSGAPLTERALDQLRRVRALAGDRLTLVASGGVMTAADAAARLAAGAALVQLMTGWIFRGTRLLEEILLRSPDGAQGNPGSSVGQRAETRIALRSIQSTPRVAALPRPAVPPPQGRALR